MSDPVNYANDYYTFVENYGTGFAPYFMALGLWVVRYAASCSSRSTGRLLLAGANPVSAAFANYLPIAVFSLIQATLLMVVLQYGLQLQIDNVQAFYAVGYLTSLVFAAIMQLLMAAFGFRRRFLAIILLMLQLTTCAGTFPSKRPSFQAVNPCVHDVCGRGHAQDHDGARLTASWPSPVLCLLVLVRGVLRAYEHGRVAETHRAHG